jgi:hypothetical protein
MFKNPLRLSVQLALVFISSVVASLMAYPEIYLTFKTSFMLFDDYLLEYFNTSIIASFMAQGSIQLWDHFGQMPFAYLFTTLGTFKFPNVIAACVFFVLSPLSDHTGALFHHVFAWANLLTLLFLRVAGIFLLLRRFIKDGQIIWIATVMSAVFYCQPAFYIGTFYQSFYPIIFYFIISFISRFEWKYFIAAFCFFVISFSNSLIHSCYMYMGVHFFILSALAWSVIYRRREWMSLKIAKGFWKTVTFMIVAAVVIIGPYVWMQKIGVHDVEFDAKNSRLGRMLSIDYYFHGAHFDQADTSELFRRMLDFTGDAGESFFFGFMILTLAIAGMVLSRDSRRWIFVSTIILVYLVNFPRDAINIGTPVHWLNALTNPFKSILRSYHMASHCVLEYLFIPLAVMGFEEMRLIFIGKSEVPARKLAITFGAVTVFVASSFDHMPGVVKIYLAIGWALLTLVGLKASFNAKSVWGKIMCATLILLILADIGLVCYQTKSMLNRYFKRQPYETVSLAEQGGLGIDLGNPLIFPVREYGAAYFAYEDALIGPLVGQPQNYFKFTNFMLNFIPIDGHNPRHKSYASWVNDKEMWQYIQKNHRMMFNADRALRADDGVLGKIVQSGLSERVIMVDDPSDKFKLPREIPVGYVPSPRPPVEAQTFSGTLADGKIIRQSERKDLVFISLPLPKDFPDYQATTFFTEDRYSLRFLLQKPDQTWQECRPAQGEFVRECSFDVGHFKKGTLTAALAKDGFFSSMKYIFVYPIGSQNGIVNAWEKKFDYLGFDYHIGQDGWFVVQYPFDKKWQISVDWKQTPYYKVNKSFIGFPITEGKHRIEMRYEPDSLLRIWLLISVICSTLGLILLLVIAFKWENAYNRTVH